MWNSWASSCSAVLNQQTKQSLASSVVVLDKHLENTSIGANDVSQEQHCAVIGL